MFDETEWFELTKKGFNAVEGADKNNVLSKQKIVYLNQPSFDISIYGKGKLEINKIKNINL